jgi:hypothetical protein
VGYLRNAVLKNSREYEDNDGLFPPTEGSEEYQDDADPII